MCIGQNNSELIKVATQAVQAKNYDAAIRYYSKIIQNIKNKKVDPSVPYEFEPYRKDNNIQDELSGVESDLDSRLFLKIELAKCYKLAQQYENYENISRELHKEKAPRGSFYYGEALMLHGKYNSAIAILNSYMSKLDIQSSDFKQAKKLVKGCLFGIEQEKTESEINLKKITPNKNATNGTFSSFIHPNSNELFFSTNNRRFSKEEIVNTNMYSLTFDENDNISVVTPLSDKINSGDNEAVGSISQDGQKLYFTRWHYDLEKPECEIYVSTFLNNVWLTPKRLNNAINTPGYNSMHPHISSKNGVNTLYFTSNKPGTVGGNDIWICELNNRDNPKNEVVNAGPEVNTINDEGSPFLHVPTNKLYFSSNGHIGLGGLDIYSITSVAGKCIPPIENVGAPINSHHDDAFYTLTADESKGFLSSNRNYCDECPNKHCYELYTFNLDAIMITITGEVINLTNNQPISNSMVRFIDVHNKYEDIFVFTDDNGKYKTKLQRDVSYYATAQKKGFFKAAAAMSTEGIKVSTDLIQDFVFRLEEVPDSEMEIKIEYDYDGWKLRKESKIVLDTLYNFLQLNDNIIIEISSHTDERGRASYNKKLSEKRAKSAVDYLLYKGIEPERLKWKGMGMEEPLIKGAKTEEEHQRNRRTAFRTLSQDYKPIRRFKYIPASLKQSK